MLTVRIEVNGKLIGGATVKNVSQLADISDYEVMTVEKGSDQTGLPDYREDYTLRNHKRRQSVWSLIRKIADRAEQAQIERAAG